MKTVIFLRHGKSDWKAEYRHDHDRPLAKRGRKAAQVMGRFLAGIEQVPDCVISSTAKRAVDTLASAREAGGWGDVEVKTTRLLYDVHPDAVLDQIRQVDRKHDVLMLVGHEPTWSMTLSALVGGGAIRFPTAAMARIDVSVDRWSDVAFGLGELIWLIPPRLLS